MSVPTDAVVSPAPKPQASPFWRGFMRVTGTLAIALFLTPSVYVVKYYALDLPREQRRARLVSTAALVPAVPLDAIAPPFTPTSPANAAGFYVAAIQSYADRANGNRDERLLLLPTAREAALLLQGAHCTQCRYFVLDKNKRPRFVFHDPDDSRDHPYQAPLTARDTYRYLSYAGALGAATKNLALVPGSPIPPHTLALALLRFGGSLEADSATRTHLAVSTAVQRMGLRVLRARPPASFQRYIDSRQTYDEAVQAKYALLEPVDPDNLALQEYVARKDSSALWRREGVWALGQTLHMPYINLRRPLETLAAKATLSDIAIHDADPSVRAAASATLGEVAEHGAVIQR